MAQALEDARESTTQMLALAPTSQGKTELQALLDMYLPNAREHVQVTTLEDWNIALLREHGEAIGIHPDVRRLDAHDDREECREALLAALNTVGVSPRWVTGLGLEAAREVLLSGPKAFFRGAEHASWINQFRVQRRALAEAYAAQLRAYNCFDEVGLVWSVLRLLAQAPAVPRALASRYTHVFVDDLHEGSVDEALVLEALGGHIAHITVAVDDDASPRIWDPVDAATLRRLAETRPMHVHYLERNYRSPEPVVHLANALRLYRWEDLPDKPPMVAVRRGTPGSSAATLAAMA
jgi:superfamily I DNA/RNA helicase